jgi:carboxymethylenebutenolidase
MIESEISIQTPDGPTEAFLFHPDTGGPFPVVIYITDIRGIRPSFMAMARRVAAEGYTVLMPNIFHRLTPVPVIDPEIPWGTPECMARFGELLGAVTPEGNKIDHLAYLDYLKTVTAAAKGKVAVVGYCMGGLYAFHAATDLPDEVAVALSFHGGGLATEQPNSPHLKADRVKSVLYFGHAAEDGSMTPEMIDRLNAALDAAKVTYETDHYPGKHGYAVVDNPSHDAASEALHWHRLFEILKQTFQN